MDWATTKIRVYAKITVPITASKTGITTPQTFDLDVVRFSADWELNGIPSAVLSVAIGRRADKLSEASNIHKIVTTFKTQLPVSVYMAVGTALSPQMEQSLRPQDNAWPFGVFRIFRGYAVGSSFRTSDTAAEFTLHLTHWLTDLAFSSAVSRTSHPMNPSQTSFNAAFPDLNLLGGGSAGMMMTPETLAASFLDLQTVINDFWAGLKVVPPNAAAALAANGGVVPSTKGLRGFYEALSRTDRITSTNTFRNLIPSQQLNTDSNWEALRALQHFEPSSRYTLGDGTNVQEAGYVDGTAMALDMYGAENGNIGPLIAQAISLDVGRESLQTMAGYTLWDKLVGQLAPKYLFAVIPMVEKALIVPYTPGLKWTTANGARLITTKDYDNIELSTNMPVPVRGVVLMTSMGSTTGSISNGNQPFSTFLPNYISTSRANQGGQLIFKEVPQWLSAVLPWTYPGALGAGGTTPIANANFPTVGFAANALPRPREVIGGVRNIANEYAHALYVQEVTKGRRAVLSGRLRMDISPGTMVKIQVEDSIRLNPSIVSSHLHGIVHRVSCVIDAQASKAGTAFQIGFITDQDEQASSDTVVSRHPIWKNSFYGASLVVTKDVPTDPFRHRSGPAMPPSRGRFVAE